MPQLERVDQLPLPNLNLYVGLSSLALFYTAVYAFTSTQSSFLSMVWSDVWCLAVSLLGRALKGQEKQEERCMWGRCVGVSYGEKCAIGGPVK